MSQREAGGQKARNKKGRARERGKREEAVIAQGPAKSRSCGREVGGGRVKIFVMRDAEQDKPGSFSRNQRPAHKVLKAPPQATQASRALSSVSSRGPIVPAAASGRKVFADGLGR